MKKINLTIYLSILTLVTIAIPGCKKSLEVTDPTKIAESDSYTTEQEALFGLYGIYDAYQTGNLFGSSIANFDVAADNITENSSSDGFRAFEMSTQDPFSNPRVDGFYLGFYTVINRANYVIKRVKEMTAGQISDNSRKRIIAEASFLRDYAYFFLVNLYRDIPFYTEPLGAGSTPLGPTKSKEIFAKLKADLIDQIPGMPTTISSGENGRSSKGAAMTLLGMLYLYDKDYSNALATLKPLLSAPYAYTLYPKYGALFLPNAEFTSESIFEISFDGSNNDQSASFSTQIDTTMVPAKPRNALSPTGNLVDSYLCTDGKPIANSVLYGTKSPLYKTGITRFDNRDPRLRASILTQADVLSNGKKLWSWDNNNSFGVKKYMEVTTTKYANNPQNFYVFRFADVLLMVAEAQNELVGSPDALVYDCVNKIRQRVSMPEYPAGLSQAQMRERIRDERRWEFAMEYQRYFDLKRWGIIQTAIANSGVAQKVFTNPRDYVWPIPQTELDRNPNMDQAPEWK